MEDAISRAMRPERRAAAEGGREHNPGNPESRSPGMSTSTRKPARGGTSVNPLPADELHRIDAYWRAANYLSVGQIYLYDNPS
jgi:hypothetical protein